MNWGICLKWFWVYNHKSGKRNNIAGVFHFVVFTLIWVDCGTLIISCHGINISNILARFGRQRWCQRNSWADGLGLLVVGGMEDLRG